jgi:hypothetical protein
LSRSRSESSATERDFSVLSQLQVEQNRAQSPLALSAISRCCLSCELSRSRSEPSGAERDFSVLSNLRVEQIALRALSY